MIPERVAVAIGRTPRQRAAHRSRTFLRQMPNHRANGSSSTVLRSAIQTITATMSERSSMVGMPI